MKKITSYVIYFTALCIVGSVLFCNPIEEKLNHMAVNNELKSLVENKEKSIDQNTEAFTGKNFSVLPKQLKIPVIFDKSVDGDTFKALINNNQVKIRLLLIDTPESVKVGMPVQPYGLESSNYTKKLLENAKSIEIEFDKGDRADKYGRALCYVYVDGELLQSKLAYEGVGRVAYVRYPNVSKLAEIKEYETLAKENLKGIWSLDNYVTDRGYNY